LDISKVILSDRKKNVYSNYTVIRNKHGTHNLLFHIVLNSIQYIGNVVDEYLKKFILINDDFNESDLNVLIQRQSILIIFFLHLRNNSMCLTYTQI